MNGWVTESTTLRREELYFGVYNDIRVITLNIRLSSMRSTTPKGGALSGATVAFLIRHWQFALVPVADLDRGFCSTPSMSRRPSKSTT